MKSHIQALVFFRSAEVPHLLIGVIVVVKWEKSLPSARSEWFSPSIWSAGAGWLKAIGT